MPEEPRAIVSPADSRVLVGSLETISELFIKGKVFSDWKNCWAVDKNRWLGNFLRRRFRHFPPDTRINTTSTTRRWQVRWSTFMKSTAAITPATRAPWSAWLPLIQKTAGWSPLSIPMFPAARKVGLVAMIEVVALMIGDIIQCYSKVRYDDPSPLYRSMFLEKGTPKSLFRPGSSTDILLFQKDRIRFAEDLVRNQLRRDIPSRFSAGFGHPLVETDVQVRSLIAMPEDRQEPINDNHRAGRAP